MRVFEKVLCRIFGPEKKTILGEKNNNTIIKSRWLGWGHWYALEYGKFIHNLRPILKLMLDKQGVKNDLDETGCRM